MRRLRLIVGSEAFAEEHRENIPLTPIEFALEQNYPNPFAFQTRIVFQLDERSSTELAVYTASGQRVALLVRGERQVGRHEVVWDGRDEHGRTLASGLYLYRLDTGRATLVKPMLLVR